MPSDFIIAVKCLELALPHSKLHFLASVSCDKCFHTASSLGSFYIGAACSHAGLLAWL